MEEQRLTPMREGYNVDLFNDYYKRTENLRKKLAYQIDASRFGVDHEEILSWFDVKFIYIFNKYWGTKNDNFLLGDLIKGLQLFKNRVLRAAYTVKFSQTIIDLSEVSYVNFIPDEQEDDEKLFYNLALSFMEKHLSENALELLYLQIEPPPFIVAKMKELQIANRNKIPNSVYAEYLELGNSAEFYIENLKSQIRKATNKAKEYFKNYSGSMNPGLPVYEYSRG